MAKLIIFSCFITILSAFILKYLQDFGVLRQIEVKHLDKCRLLLPPNEEDQAFEDFAIDNQQGIVYMGGDNRTWCQNFNLLKQYEKKKGTIFLFDISSEKFQNLDLINYPYEHFHPLGLGLLKSKVNQLFVVNYRIENDQVIGGVDIFKIDSLNKTRLNWVETVTHPLFTVPDDVLIIDENTFYVTNICHYRKDQSSFLHHFEILTKRPWTEVLLCTKKNHWQCSKIVESIIAANGIAATSDFKTVYLAATGEKRIRVYERHIENNSLSYMRSLVVPFLPDNIVVNEHDQVVVAGHSNALAFLLHQKNPRESRAPSEVVIFKDPKSSETYETLLVTNGELLSASTVGLTYKEKLLVGGFRDPGDSYVDIEPHRIRRFANI